MKIIVTNDKYNKRPGSSNRKILTLLLHVLAFLPAILVAVMIFGFSAQDAEESSRLSTEVTTQIVRSVNDGMKKGWTPAEQARMVLSWEFYVRKLAHFSEYAAFGLALSIPMYAVCRIRRWKLPLTAGLISFAYAALDEFHQHFSYGRSPQLGDVLIDTCGAMAGILLGWLIAHAVTRRKQAPLHNKA